MTRKSRENFMKIEVFRFHIFLIIPPKKTNQTETVTNFSNTQAKPVFSHILSYPTGKLRQELRPGTGCLYLHSAGV